MNTKWCFIHIYIIFSQFIIFLLLFSPEIDVRSKIFFFKNQCMRLEIFFIQKSYPTYFTITCNICWAVVFSIEQIFSTCCVVCCIKLEALHEGMDDGLIWSPHCFWNKIKNFSWTKMIFFIQIFWGFQLICITKKKDSVYAER